MSFKKIKLLLVDKPEITIKELASLIQTSRQTFYNKAKKGTFTESEKKIIAERLGCKTTDF